MPLAMRDKVFNTAALTGSGSTQDRSDKVPRSPEQIAIAAIDAAKAGAAPVDLVVLFDWPRDPNEFLRRVGRTARCGRKGHATILAAGAYLPLAREVKAACDDGRPVDSAGGDSDVF